MLLIPFFELFWAFGLVLITCELAGRMSSEFEEIDFLISQLKWYLFPVDVQKMLTTIMINAQRDVGFVCFGSAMCNRETFKNVNIKLTIHIKPTPKYFQFYFHVFVGG